MTTTVQAIALRKGRLRRPEVATQWQLMWWKYKKHHMALVGMTMLAVLVFSAVFAEFLSPVVPSERNNKYLADRKSVV